jgi:hypothetical protein
MLPEWYNEYKNFIDNSIKNYLDNYFSKDNISKPLIEFKEAIYYSTK